MTNTTIPECITDQLKKLSTQRKTLKEMIPLAQFAETLIEQFEGLPEMTNWRLLVESETCLRGVTVNVTSLDINTLTQVRHFIRQQGFPAPRQEEYRNLCIDWVYKREGEASFRLSFHPSSDKNAVCKYVKVGEKTEPVYELQCDGHSISQTG